MKQQLKNQQDELCARMKKYDEALLELLKKSPANLIIDVIKDYLSQPE